MKTITLACVFATILCSCEKRRSTTAKGEEARDRGLVVSSTHEPKGDVDALKIVRITMSPAPEVIYRHYEAGLDDNMKLVIRFPAEHISNFWSGGPWLQKDAVVSSGDGSTGRAPRISEHGAPEWLKWKSSSKGYAAEANLPDGEAARVYLSEDIEPGFIHAFIFWHET